ncbi:MAG TPA: hypothetical protein VIH90_05560 [Candidatus Saccharimonadales bacterium]
MSHSTSATINKHQKHSKVRFQQYLLDSGEPEDNIKRDNAKLDLWQLNIMVMRQKIKHQAQRLRMNYS